MYKRNRLTRFSVFLFIIFLSFQLQGKNTYTISIEQTESELLVDVLIKCDSLFDQLFIEESIDIKSLNVMNYKRYGDTLTLDKPLNNFSIKYEITKDNFSLKDGTIILKHENKWTPQIKNLIFDAEIYIKGFDEQYYIVSANYNQKSKSISIKNRQMLSIFLLPLDKYYKTESDINEKALFIYNSKTIEFNDTLALEFKRSYHFFEEFFNDYAFDYLSVILIDDNNFNICQSLNGMITFGKNFQDMFLASPEYSWVPHEVCHQWWGKNIFLKRDVEFYRFMEESVTEYLKSEYVKRTYGDYIYRKLIGRYKYFYNYATKDTTQIPIAKIREMNNQITAQTIYSKGPMVLSATSRIDGCELNNVIKEIYAENAGKEIQYQVLKEKLIERITSKKMQSVEKILYGEVQYPKQ